MNIFRNLFKKGETRDADTKNITILSGEPDYFTNSGYVSPEGSLASAAVFSCVRILSEYIASIPFKLYKQNGDRKEIAYDHPLYSVIHDTPNPDMTAYTFKNILMRSLLLRGNFYAEIEYDQRTGRVLNLYPILPDFVQVKMNNGQVVYEVLTQNGSVILPAYRIFHVKVFSRDGILGQSIVSIARNQISNNICADDFGYNFFKNNGKPSGYWTMPPELTDEEALNFSKSIKNSTEGLSNAHRTPLVPDGFKFNNISLNQKDSQWIETRQFQKQEIAAIFRVPPHMIGDLSRATFSNIEQQSIDFVTQSLMPWYSNIESEITRQLIQPFERKMYFAKAVPEGLLRSDMKSRFEAYAIGRNGGWYSVNDIRRLEDLDPIDGGDTYLVPLNMSVVGAETPQGAPKNPLADAPQPEPGQSNVMTRARTSASASTEHRSNDKQPAEKIAARRLKLRSVYQPLIREAIKRTLKVNVKEIGAGARKHLNTRSSDTFAAFLETYYANNKDMIVRNLEPVLRAYCQQVAEAAAEEIGIEYDGDVSEMVDKYIQSFAARFNGRSMNELLKVLRENQTDDPLLAIESRLNDWEENSADTIADNEANRSESYFATAAWTLLGVSTIRWAANAGCCPICSEMDGRVVEITKTFLKAGDSVNVNDGETEDLTTQTSVAHPPLHRGCSCCVVADS